MASRAGDWIAQARADLDMARRCVLIEKFDWGCFAAHQAAEKAVKAVYQALGGEARGHSVQLLLRALAPRVAAPQTVADAAARLDVHYIPTRYPNGLAAGHPAGVYTRSQAEDAANDAAAVVGFCDGHLVRPGEGAPGGA